MTPSTATDAHHQIDIVPSARRFSAATGETVLGAAIRQGIGMPYGCKDGACGSCKCKLLSGQVRHGAHQSKALSAQEEASGWVLPCCALAQSDLVLESHQVAAEGLPPVRRLLTRVSRMQRLASDVMLLRLQLPAGEAFVYRPGQYIELLLSGGVRRSYSMASAATLADGTLELHIRHLPAGKFSEHVFTRMQDKELLRIEGPMGSFYLREHGDKAIILLASGTGFAPIKAILEELQAQGSLRAVTLYWGGRHTADLYQHAWVQSQLQHMPHLRYVPVLSEADAQDAWSGRTGLVHAAVLADHPDLGAHQVYACGAPVMVDAARHDFTTLAGLPEHEFFADAFVSHTDSAVLSSA